MGTFARYSLSEVYRSWEDGNGRLSYTSEEHGNSRPSHCLIIDPLSRFRVMWDAVAFAIISYQVVTVPLEVAFLSDGQSARGVDSLLLWVDFLAGLFFLVDLGLNCVTAYSDKGKYVANQRLILLNYLRGFFLIDVLSLVPLTLTFLEITSVWSGGDGSAAQLTRTAKTGRFLKQAKVVRMLRLLRIARARKTVRRLAGMIIFSGRGATLLFQLLSVVSALVLVIHLLACLWRIVALFEQHAMYLGISQDSVWESYAMSVWWTVATLTDSPPLDPLSTQEMLWWSASSLVAVILNSVGLAYTVQVFDTYREEQKQYNEQMRIAQRFMMSHGLPEQVKVRVVSAVREANHQKRRWGGFKDQIEPLLSRDLLFQVYGHIHGATIARFPPFKDSQAANELVLQRFRYRLAYDATIASYSPGDTIFEELKPGSTMIFFVEGRAKLHSWTQKLDFPEVVEGWWLGEKVLLSADPTRSASCHALLPCTTLEIHVSKFKEAVAEFKLEAWLDRMVRKGLNGEPWGCPACGGDDHFVRSCGLLVVSQGRSAEEEPALVPVGQLARANFERQASVCGDPKDGRKSTAASDWEDFGSEGAAEEECQQAQQGAAAGAQRAADERLQARQSGAPEERLPARRSAVAGEQPGSGRSTAISALAASEGSRDSGRHPADREKLVGNGRSTAILGTSVTAEESLLHRRSQAATDELARASELEKPAPQGVVVQLDVLTELVHEVRELRSLVLQQSCRARLSL